MYPFRPKSTAHLKPGQYWSFKVEGNRFVAGVVISLRRKDGTIDRRLFLAGLLDWCGDTVPQPHDLESKSIRERGFAHIKAIAENGGEILGEFSPCWDFPSEIEPTDSISTWGYGVIRVYAQKYYG
jgi:hypothetical protein